MSVMLWDASGLAKRYAPEAGSDTVDALFATSLARRMVSSAVSYAEIHSLLLRKRNRAAINQAAFDAAVSALRAELFHSPDFALLSIDDAAFYSGIALMEAHNINATDAALLALFLRYTQSYAPANRPAFLLIAADQRLVRAAHSEGLNAVDPETLSAGDVPALLASL